MSATIKQGSRTYRGKMTILEKRAEKFKKNYWEDKQNKLSQKLLQEDKYLVKKELERWNKLKKKNFA